VVTVALISTYVRVGDLMGNWLRLKLYARLAAASGAELEVFPEYCLTGFRCWWFGDAASHWELLGMVERLARLTGTYIALGLMEPPEVSDAPSCPAYNSAVLVSPEGSVVLRHRKWEEPILFCRGSEVSVADTPFGRVALIVCGDLFNDEVRNRVKGLDVDYLIVPMDRSGSPGVDYDFSEEVKAMGDAVRDCGIRHAALIVNTHGHEGSHGFALVIDSLGKPLSVLRGEGMLLSSV